MHYLHRLKSLDDEPEQEVDKILNHRLVKRGRKNKVAYLIKFVGYGPEHNMWMMLKAVRTWVGLIGLANQNLNAFMLTSRSMRAHAR